MIRAGLNCQAGRVMIPAKREARVKTERSGHQKKNKGSLSQLCFLRCLSDLNRAMIGVAALPDSATIARLRLHIDTYGPCLSEARQAWHPTARSALYKPLEEDDDEEEEEQEGPNLMRTADDSFFVCTLHSDLSEDRESQIGSTAGRRFSEFARGARTEGLLTPVCARLTCYLARAAEDVGTGERRPFIVFACTLLAVALALRKRPQQPPKHQALAEDDAWNSIIQLARGPQRIGASANHHQRVQRQGGGAKAACAGDAAKQLQALRPEGGPSVPPLFFEGQAMDRFEREVTRIYAVDHSKPPLGEGSPAALQRLWLMVLMVVPLGDDDDDDGKSRPSNFFPARNVADSLRHMRAACENLEAELQEDGRIFEPLDDAPWSLFRLQVFMSRQLIAADFDLGKTTECPSYVDPPAVELCETRMAPFLGQCRVDSSWQEQSIMVMTSCEYEAARWMW
ncbi:hypothetical protein AK812_SmicGene36913 [Symbiodinium microadriaticum]|uniref:Uncharacterized protein n=1 Tax=Symbiodinium microadriaticum TaxID=2951 RepID=A0A1Q9CHM0_SYMMI|nr:hypothetical protein AK812_SmicGene36913 [Symbiodinium microadriaticum]